MKKLNIILSLLILFALSVNAEIKSDSSKVIHGHKNLIKINLPALALRTYALEYERAIGRKTAASFGFRLMPKGGIPLQGTIDNLIDDPETSKQLNSFEISNQAFTPQIKFYFGKDIFKGFYLAPFARFANYKVNGDFNFDVNGTEEIIPLDGELTTITGGLEIGVQFRMGKHIHLNFNFGPQFGSSKGDFNGRKNLNTQEQDALRDDLEDFKIPFVEQEITVNSTGVNMKVDGPWGGLKGGIMLGYRF
ncbi:DUF3575 domain-containing protein [Pedobacter alpinus]|uniref:DUF3575 domain-containing protein n=1 Tax=Pedobacter alpinus TaxID=1590643 RepID=A0ABW5TSS0_9SPHI